ncbi:DUF1830 domain-containing protein [Cyanobacterium stanieri LEGE 03274]|uniref:DUF1830 domain-containing protein n=1 Tax=Cyanobacterium stanieri LEGE 03274 TaxID=1828756 RepID=A0ABR9V3S2_9CHRO|nr:DUF1830 domain-containing protein [Cyanobacterium stanieri]MBE9222550.1 DUF1830 domain-containing protein [Cyanobacterium stanieri LEGE 03274]
MAQILDAIPNDDNNKIMCCYVNATSQIQVARITNVANWYFERVVFPGQRLIFEALPEALLEIHSGMMASSILSDTIPCGTLSIQEEIEGNENQNNTHPSSESPTENLELLSA